MTWAEVHDRHRLARSLLREVEQQSDVTTIKRAMPDIVSTFGSFDVFLKHLEHIWILETQVRIDFAVECGRGNDPARICDLVAQQEPGIRLVLEAYADHPALRGSPATRALERLRPAYSRP